MYYFKGACEGSVFREIEATATPEEFALCAPIKGAGFPCRESQSCLGKKKGVGNTAVAHVRRVAKQPTFFELVRRVGNGTLFSYDVAERRRRLTNLVLRSRSMPL